jgi:ATP/maltotriose-dependent transcriptional regulator MalT
MSLRDATEAVLSLESSERERAAAHLDRIFQRNQHDTLITTFRAKPEMLEAAKSLPARRDALAELLLASRERRLGERYGILETDPSSTPLSAREQEVLALLVQGLRNKEIGQTLFISEVTVKSHLRRIFRKLGVKTRTEAVIAASAALDQAAPAVDNDA